MILDLRRFRDGSGEIRGTAEKDVFELSDDDPIRPVAPYEYDIRVISDEGMVTITGLLKSRFSMPCGRCLEEFEHEVILPGYLHVEEIEGRATIDLTKQVREDILLALPAYPLCDQHGGRSTCPAADLVESTKTSPEPEEEAPGVWDALEGWDQKKD